MRVIDFGIADEGEAGGQTKTGSLRGKLAYMPPEQARGGAGRRAYEPRGPSTSTLRSAMRRSRASFDS